MKHFFHTLIHQQLSSCNKMLKLLAIAIFLIFPSSIFASILSDSPTNPATNPNPDPTKIGQKVDDSGTQAKAPSSTQNSDSEAAKMFFNQATYEDFAPQEEFKLFDPSYLEPPQ